MRYDDSRFNKYSCPKNQSTLAWAAARSSVSAHSRFLPRCPNCLRWASWNRLIQTGQKLESLGSDLSNYCSAVLGVTETRDQATFFHAVEQARDIWIPSNHPPGNFSARQAVRRSPQNAEHVVLCRRDILRFQDLG